MKLLFSGLFFVLLMQGCSGENGLVDCSKLNKNLEDVADQATAMCTDASRLEKKATLPVVAGSDTETPPSEVLVKAHNTACTLLKNEEKKLVRSLPAKCKKN